MSAAPVPARCAAEVRRAGTRGRCFRNGVAPVTACTGPASEQVVVCVQHNRFHQPVVMLDGMAVGYVTGGPA